MTTDLVKRLRACCECEQAPLGPLLCESADLIESQAKEIARLKAGGCARDQGLTQYCAEAAGMAKEIARLCHLWFSDADPKETEYRDQYAALKDARQMTEADVDEMMKRLDGYAADYWSREVDSTEARKSFRAHLMQFVGSGG